VVRSQRSQFLKVKQQKDWTFVIPACSVGGNGDRN